MFSTRAISMHKYIFGEQKVRAKMNTDIIISRQNVPANIDDLSRFVLIGRDRLTAVRAAIRAIDKVGVAADVYQQKLAEGQEIAEAVLDAEVRLGKLRASVPRENGKRTDKPRTDDRPRFDTPVQEFDAAVGFGSTTMKDIEKISNHPAIVEQAKANAREEGRIVTRQDVLKAIKAEQKAADIEKAKADIAAQTRADANAPVLFVGDSIGFKASEKVDLLLTDPPYSTDVEDIEGFAASWLPAALDNVKDTGFAYVFIGAYSKEVRAYLNVPIPPHMKLTQLLQWEYKNTLGNNPKDRYKQNYQTILFYRGVNAPALDCPLTNEQWAVQEINAPDGRQGDRYHAWQKPMEIAERFIRHSTKPGMTVYDPFACTGTFLLAAAKLGRKAFGFEISESNAAIAFERGCVRG